MRILIVLALISISTADEKMRAGAFKEMCQDSSKQEYCVGVIDLTKIMIMKREPGKFCPTWEEKDPLWLSFVRTYTLSYHKLMVGEVVEKILNRRHLCPINMI